MSSAFALETRLGALDAWVTHFKLRRCAAVGASPRVMGRVWVHGEGQVFIGDRVVFDAASAPIELYPWAGAAIIIGDDAFIGGGTSFEATESITVGARVTLGGFSRIMDNHFHPLVGDRNARPPSRPVLIEDDVALGPRSIVLGADRARHPRSRRVDHQSRADGGVVVNRGEALREALRTTELLLASPAAGRVRVVRALGVLRALALFRKCTTGELVNATGYVHVVADGRLVVGDRVQLSGGMIPTSLVCRAGGELTIGARTFFNYGVSVEASERVVIGERCMFGSMSRVRDSGESGHGPVVICDDVWVAHGAIVEPGVTIGEASVVSAGSVVRSDVPPHSLAIGNPAVCVPLVRRARETSPSVEKRSG
jgi:acetyltransferase-like isoleucine patch superfamily enzyme